MNWLDALGIAGQGLFAWATVVTAWKTLRAGEDVTPLASQWTFFVANVLFGVYLLAAFGPHWPFLGSGVEVASWGVVLRYHYWPRRRYSSKPVGMCTREVAHTGPCNGFPNPTCSVWDSGVGYARPLKHHGK